MMHKESKVDVTEILMKSNVQDCSCQKYVWPSFYTLYLFYLLIFLPY